MDDPMIFWDLPEEEGGNTAHVAEHGLTPDGVDVVIRDTDLSVETSHSSGRPCKFGWTETGKHIIVIWEIVDEDPLTIYPITAYEVPPPR